MRAVEERLAQLEEDLQLPVGTPRVMATTVSPIGRGAIATPVAATPPAPTVSAEEPALSTEDMEAGWETHVSRSTGRTYFYSRRTGESTFTHPRERRRAAAPSPADSAGRAVASPRSPLALVGRNDQLSPSSAHALSQVG